MLEQQYPGEEEPSEEDLERRGIPDGWIFDSEGWCVFIESKVIAICVSMRPSRLGSKTLSHSSELASISEARQELATRRRYSAVRAAHSLFDQPHRLKPRNLPAEGQDHTLHRRRAGLALRFPPQLAADSIRSRAEARARTIRSASGCWSKTATSADVSIIIVAGRSCHSREFRRVDADRAVAARHSDGRFPTWQSRFRRGVCRLRFSVKK